MHTVKTAIVFGGACEDGRNICNKLVSDKYYTFCVDDLSGHDSIHPSSWDDNFMQNPRFFFFEEKWENFVATEICIEAHIEVVVFLIKLEIGEKDKPLCSWLNTLDVYPKKIIIKHDPAITTNPIWEFILNGFTRETSLIS